jgi:hypothetical protein
VTDCLTFKICKTCLYLADLPCFRVNVCGDRFGQKAERYFRSESICTSSCAGTLFFTGVSSDLGSFEK